MELSALERKQKRLKDWCDFLERGVFDAQIKPVFESTLKDFKSVLVKCWQMGSVSPDEAATISDLERRIEQLDEEARLNPSSHTTLTKAADRH